MFLIYRQGTRGPTPAKCAELPLVKSVNGQTAELLATHKLDAETFKLPLSTLARLFPPPVKTESVP